MAVLLAVAGVVPDPVAMFEFVALGFVAGVVPDVLACGAGAAVGDADAVVGLAFVDVVVGPVVDPTVLDCVLLVDGLLVDGLLVDGVLPVPPGGVLLLPPVVLPPLPVFAWELWMV